MTAAPPPAMGRRAPRALGTGAALATASIVVTYALLGINSVAIARLEGASATGLVTLATQIVFLGIFVAGLGVRTGAASLVGSGRWPAADI